MLIPWEIWRDNFIQDAPEAMARDLDEGSPCAGLD